MLKKHTGLIRSKQSDIAESFSYIQKIRVELYLLVIVHTFKKNLFTFINQLVTIFLIKHISSAMLNYISNL